MARRPEPQISFFDPEFADPGCLVVGTLPWLLARHKNVVFPNWLFEGWRPESELGPKGWPASVLMTLLVLRWNEEGMSRRAAIRQAGRNTTWRAAMGLRIGEDTPSARTVGRFEGFLGERHPACGTPRYLLVHEHFVRLCLGSGVLGDRSVWAMDSTPMWAYGAMHGTVRLLGDGLRSLGKQWARLKRMSLEVLAEQWRLPLLLARSTKGSLAVDWRTPEGRANAVDPLAADVLRVVDLVRTQIETLRANKRKGILRQCRNLLKVIADDLETDEQGRLVVAHKVTAGRMVSITDPDARHGRKSRSQTYKGFKVSVLGDVVSGLLLSLAVTPGGSHDSVPAHRLIHRARELHGKIERVLADTAYGGARLRHIVQHVEGVELLSPPPPVTLKPGKLGRQDMAFDLQAGTATCVAGVTTDDLTWPRSREYDVNVRQFRWPAKTCQGCSLREACSRPSGKGRGHAVRLHPYEEELVAARQAWERPEVRQDYRVRSQCERLVNQVTRHGGRTARTWGLAAANLQAHLIAMRCNLALLAQALTARDDALVRAA
jgi:hypothetical protein